MPGVCEGGGQWLSIVKPAVFGYRTKKAPGRALADSMVKNSCAEIWEVVLVGNRPRRGSYKKEGWPLISGGPLQRREASGTTAKRGVRLFPPGR